MGQDTMTKWIFPWEMSGFAVLSHWLCDAQSGFPYLTVTISLVKDEKPHISLQLHFCPSPLNLCFETACLIGHTV